MNGKPDSYWQTHMIGTEWIRVDFTKPTRITGLKVHVGDTMLVTPFSLKNCRHTILRFKEAVNPVENISSKVSISK